MALDGRSAGGDRGALVIERLAGLPGGEVLLELARDRDDVELVGGATRDLLLGSVPRELDVVVAADARAFAGELLTLLAPAPHQTAGAIVHERFGTAIVSIPGGRIDIATRRAEAYPSPGELPQVRAGTPQEDLLRRDFTVNAIAVGLAGESRGMLRAAPHALEDLSAGRLRVLTEHSFHDDPTRLLRLARYRARLSFEPEHRTAELAVEALEDGVLATVSGSRIGAELRLALAEPDALAALSALGELGVLGGLQPPLGFIEPRARPALELLPGDGQAEVLLLACLLLAGAPALGDALADAMRALLDELEFPAAERDRALASALGAGALAARLDPGQSPSEIRAAVGDAPVEAVALAAALADELGLAGGQPARRWLEELRHVALQITGDDLLAEGVPAGPQIGRRLEHALRRKLDGELPDRREAELSAALED